MTQMMLPDVFWERAAEEDRSHLTPCWIWAHALNGKGYASFTGGGFKGFAHRLAYVALISDIPIGLELDHLCRVACCVNPYHLEPVTHAENVRRSLVDKTHCVNGHEYTPENTYRQPIPGREGAFGRVCRVCRKEQDHARHPGELNSAKTRCPSGHEYTSENTVMDQGRRRCLTCRRATDRRRNARGRSRRMTAAQGVGE